MVFNNENNYAFKDQIKALLIFIYSLLFCRLIIGNLTVPDGELTK